MYPDHRHQKRARGKRRDDRRRAEQPWRAWYKLARWLRLREQQLRTHPLCQRCGEAHPPRITPATTVHHVARHEGDPVKFWGGPFASLCKPCHDSIEQGIEARGYDTGCDVMGRPTDPNHPWNR